MGLEKGSSWDGLGKDKGVLKPNAKNLVKGKKALARARASQTNSLSAVRIAGRKNSPSSLLTHDGESQNGDEDQCLRNSPEFLFTSAPWPGTSSQSREGDHRGSSSEPCRGANEADPSVDLVLCDAPKGREILFVPDGGDIGAFES